MISIHVLAGTLTLFAGACALFSRKGSRLHRGSGLLFVAAMIVMTASAFVMAAFLRPNRLNVLAALVTFYLVCTALLTVRGTWARTRALHAGFMLMALATSAYAFDLAVQAWHGDSGRLDGMPPQPLYLFGIIAALAALGDARILLSGRIDGTRRLTRHLWRMGFAMFIATASLFLGQAKLFPQPLRSSGVLAIPVLMVVVTVLFWTIRLRLLRRRGGTLPVALRPGPGSAGPPIPGRNMPAP